MFASKKNGRTWRRKSEAVSHRSSQKTIATALTFGRGLDQAGKNKGEVVARVEAVPKGTGSKGDQASSEAGLFAARGDAKIDVIAQPVIRVHVPSAKVCSWILRRLDPDRIDVL